MQVLSSYEEGVYAVLFSSVPDEDVKEEWITRANARTQRVMTHHCIIVQCTLQAVAASSSSSTCVPCCVPSPRCDTVAGTDM